MNTRQIIQQYLRANGFDGLALAALSLIAAGAQAIMAESQAIKANLKRSTRQTSGSYWGRMPGRKGPGWSAAHVKRMAVKSRKPFSRGMFQ